MTTLEAGEFLVENFDHLGPTVVLALVVSGALYFLGKKALKILEGILKHLRDENTVLRRELQEERNDHKANRDQWLGLILEQSKELKELARQNKAIAVRNEELANQTLSAIAQANQVMGRCSR